MKNFILGIYLLSFLVAFNSCKSIGEDVKPTPEPPLISSIAKKPEPFGVNLAGAEFGNTYPGILNRHYGYPTAADLDYFKSKGLTLIRFPFRWERIQHNLYGTLDADELGRMKMFVQAARDRGMKVLLDMHNYCRRGPTGDELEEIGSASVPLASIGDVWGKIALEFKEYDNIWGYGLMNEPYSLTKLTWFEIAQLIINKIRLVDTKTTIVVGGDSFSSASRWKSVSDNLKNLSDPFNNIIYEAHTYFDKDASGQYKGTYDQEQVSENTGIQRVTPFVEWLTENRKRGFVGEYGIPRDDPRYLIVLDKMLKYLSDNCVNGTYWAAGPRWPQNDHLSIQPWNGDLPQVNILQKYLQTNPAICK